MNRNSFNILLKSRYIFENLIVKTLEYIVVLIVFLCFNPECIMNMAAAIWFSC